MADDPPDRDDERRHGNSLPSFEDPADLRYFVDRIAEGLYVTTPDGDLVDGNPALAEIFGAASLAELFEHRVGDLLAHPEARAEHTRLLDEKGEIRDQELEIRRLDGSVATVLDTAFAYRDADGEIVAYLGILRDISERKSAQQALQESESRYRRLVELSPEMVAVHRAGKLVYVNPSGAAMLGCDGTDEMVERPVLEFVHPDYRDEVRRRVRHVAAGGEADLFEEKFVRRDGEVIDVEVVSGPIRYGGDDCHLVLARDVTERNVALEAMRESEERYRTILESVEDGYFEVDIAGNLTFFNDGLEQILGYPAEELVGMNNREYMDEETARSVYRMFNRVFRTGQPIQGFEWEVVRADGDRCHVEASVSLIRDRDDGPIGFRGIVRDVSERKSLERRLEEQSRRDPLTGAYNRRFLNTIRPGLERTAASWGCLMFDFDRFKEINDIYGHDEGDRVLQAFAHFVRRHGRADDTLIRYGGDEFVLLIEVGSEEELDAIARRLTESAPDESPIGFSMGTAFRGDDESVEDVLKRADRAMYAAKGRGDRSKRERKRLIALPGASDPQVPESDREGDARE